MLVSAGALQSGQLVGKWSTSSASRSSVSAVVVEPSSAAPTAVGCEDRAAGFPPSSASAAPFYDRERKSCFSGTLSFPPIKTCSWERRSVRYIKEGPCLAKP